jgi:hypothetical protein
MAANIWGAYAGDTERESRSGDEDGVVSSRRVQGIMQIAVSFIAKWSFTTKFI